jgi:hypothetical protein
VGHRFGAGRGLWYFALNGNSVGRIALQSLAAIGTFAKASRSPVARKDETIAVLRAISRSPIL